MGCLNVSVLNMFDINRGFELLSFRVWDTIVWWFDVEILLFEFSSDILLCTTIMYVFLMNNFTRINWQQQKWVTIVVLSYNLSIGFLLTVIVVNVLVWSIYLVGFIRLLIMFKTILGSNYVEGLCFKILALLERNACGYIIWSSSPMYWCVLFNYVISILYRHTIVIATGIVNLNVDVYLGGVGCALRVMIFTGVHVVNCMSSIYYIFQLWCIRRKYIKSFVLNCKSVIKMSNTRDWVWSIRSTILGCYELSCRRRSLILCNGSAVFYAKICIIFHLNMVGEIIKDQLRFMESLTVILVKQSMQCVTYNSTTSRRLMLLQYII